MRNGDLGKIQFGKIQFKTTEEEEDETDTVLSI